MALQACRAANECGCSSTRRTWNAPSALPLPKLELATGQSGHGWAVIDVTDELGTWIASHKYAEAFFEEPSDFTSAIIDKFETELDRRRFASSSRRRLMTLWWRWSGSPRSSRSCERRVSSPEIDDDANGRLLVLFPGLHDPETHSFRLLDARDGFNYRARVIDPQKDIA